MKKQIHITKADQIKLAAMMEGMKRRTNVNSDG
jgi:hypothetical protein